MNALIQAGRYEEAYVLAQSGLFEYEGEANFDFAYGLAALESGRPDEAVFAFERVAFNNHNQQRVKLELARAYFLSENYAASETLFNEVLASNPTPNVRNNVEAFLALIEQAQSASRSVLSFDMGYNTGYDTNINSATELGVIDTPIGDVTLSPGGQQINNHYREFVSNIRYVDPIDNNSNVAIQGNYRNRNNLDSNQFDLDIGSIQFGYNHGLNQQLRYNHALRV
jgi:tetratricopeptide (TPR) repeat protein